MNLRKRFERRVTPRDLLRCADHSFFAKRLSLIGLFFLVACTPQPPKEVSAPTMHYDVVVYGATSGGVIAAYAAKKMGKSVILIEPGRHLGGLSSGGLGFTDVGDETGVNGLARDFYRRVGDYYGPQKMAEMKALFDKERPHMGRLYGPSGLGWTFEPHVAQLVFEAYLDEAEIEVLYSRRVISVEKSGTDIETATFEYAGDGTVPDLTFGAHVFIDTTYEGDLMAKAGVSYTIGRESNDEYDEMYNGAIFGKTKGVYGQPETETEYPDGVDPYVVPGDPSSGLIAGITADYTFTPGKGDRAVQAYNFRMCLCQDEDRLPIVEPEGYNPATYELLARMLAIEPWESIHDGFRIHPMPYGKSDWNNQGGYGFSTDFIGGAWDYPDGDYQTRDTIWKTHETYQQGLLWFIVSDPRVPARIREEMREWGYCRDEFIDTDGWPHALYVREARRMIGSYVITEKNVYNLVEVDDGIAYGSYHGDSHSVIRFLQDGRIESDGNFVTRRPGRPPYAIPYRALTPKEDEVSNLFVTFALSATHSGFGSARMEPVFMATSQAAAVAASLSIDEGISVQDVDTDVLRSILHDRPLLGDEKGISDLEAYRLK